MTRSIIAGVVWPVVATGAILLLSAILRRCAQGMRPPSVDRAGKGVSFDDAVSSIAVAAGYCAGHVAVLGLPSFPPVSAEHWLIPVAVGVGILAVLEGIRRLPTTARWVARGTAFGAFLIFPIGPMWRYFFETQDWSRWTTAGWIGAFATVFAAGWVSQAVSMRRSAGWMVAVPFGVAIAGLAVVLGLSGSASLGQLAGSLAVSLGVLTLAGALAAGRRPIGGAVLVCWFLMVAALFNGFTFGEVAPLPASLLALAPFSTLVGAFAPGSQRRRWSGGITAAGLSLLLVAVAVFFAYRDYASLEELPY